MNDFDPMAIAGRSVPDEAPRRPGRQIGDQAPANLVAREQLRAFVERIERLEEEKQTVADDIKSVYGESKAMGFDTKILKRVIALRKKDEQQRMEEDLILDTYLQALGMLPDE